ncbi:HlyD family efflux transporter periplasmic adaptor subunit [Shewanella glacialimarina]|nr:HlyD family efflux transporter periplasmic adaptor subunit [Shewanella glacialimarina]
MKVSYNASPKSSKPQTDSGLKVPYADAKRSGFKTRWYLLLLLVIIPLVLISWILIRPEIFILANGIITTEPLEVRSPYNGVLVNLDVSGGDKVKKGNVILTISNPQLDAKITKLKDHLDKFERESVGLDNAIFLQLRQRISIAEEGVTAQERLVKQYQDLQQKNKGLIASAEMAMVHQTYISSKMELAKSKADLAQEKQRQKILSSAGSVTLSKNEIELELVSLIAIKNQLTTTAPFDSQIVDIMVQSGEYIVENQPMLLISGRKKPVITAYLAPKYFSHAQIGQQATIKLPDGSKLRAKISEPTELVSRLPQQLSGPFEGDKAVLKIILTPDDSLPVTIEGLPVEVIFDYQ